MQLPKLWHLPQQQYFIWIYKLTFHSHPPNRFSVSAFKFLLLSCFRCLQLVKLPGGARSHTLLFRLNSLRIPGMRTIQSHRISLEVQPKSLGKDDVLQLTAGTAARLSQGRSAMGNGTFRIYQSLLGLFGQGVKGQSESGHGAPMHHWPRDSAGSDTIHSIFFQEKFTFCLQNSYFRSLFYFISPHNPTL